MQRHMCRHGRTAVLRFSVKQMTQSLRNETALFARRPSGSPTFRHPEISSTLPQHQLNLLDYRSPCRKYPMRHKTVQHTRFNSSYMHVENLRSAKNLLLHEVNSSVPPTPTTARSLRRQITYFSCTGRVRARSAGHCALRKDVKQL